jgi:glycosyltransferase involved in cell wall biosynthesis
VAIEGMQMGALVVASDTGGLSELIQAGVNGWLVPPRSSGILRQALSEALALARRPDDPRTLAIREAAARTAAQHDVYAIGERILRAYGELTRSKK